MHDFGGEGRHERSEAPLKTETRWLCSSVRAATIDGAEIDLRNVLLTLSPEHVRGIPLSIFETLPNKQQRWYKPIFTRVPGPSYKH